MKMKNSNHRLDGKVRKSDPDEIKNTTKRIYQRGVPDFDYEIGNLKFIRIPKKENDNSKSKQEIEFQPFSGSGKSLRHTKDSN